MRPGSWICGQVLTWVTTANEFVKGAVAMTQLLSRSADEAGYGVLVFGVDPARLPGDAALASAQLGKEVQPGPGSTSPVNDSGPVCDWRETRAGRAWCMSNIRLFQSDMPRFL